MAGLAMITIYKFALLTALAFTFFTPGAGFALTFQELDSRIAECSSVVINALEMPEKGIPKDLLKKCRGIAIFPGLLKIGVIFGVSSGDGIVMRRDEKTGQWSKPAFFKIQSGSFGLQLGAQYTDLILLIMSEGAVQRLLEDKFILGADISVAAGPIGREASAETNTGFESGILSYSRTMGLFAGVALNGATLRPNKEANAVYHGKGVTVQDVFYEGLGATSENALTLIGILDKAVGAAPPTEPKQAQ